jgi:hypothetical protein
MVINAKKKQARALCQSLISTHMNGEQSMLFILLICFNFTRNVT